MKTTLRTIALGAMLIVSAGANAQLDLSGVLGKITGSSSSSSSSTTSGIVSAITSIFSGDKQASTDNLVGTWEYAEPAIVLSSDNILTKAGASVAAGKIEEKISGVLTKFGIKEGAFSITFNSDGTFSETIASKKISGTWTVSDGKLNLTIAKKTVSITTQLSGSKLSLVVDATKLLTFLKTIGSGSSNSSVQSITALMSSVDGLQAGVTLVKK